MEILGIGRGWVGNECGTDRRFGHGYDTCLRPRNEADGNGQLANSPSTSLNSKSPAHSVCIKALGLAQSHENSPSYPSPSIDGLAQAS